MCGMSKHADFENKRWQMAAISNYSLAHHNVGASYSNGPCCLFEHLSVRHMQILFLKISNIDLWLVENSNRKSVFPIQNLPLDSQLEVWFRHFRCFCVGTSNIIILFVCLSVCVFGCSLITGEWVGRLPPNFQGSSEASQG